MVKKNEKQNVNQTQNTTIKNFKNKSKNHPGEQDKISSNSQNRNTGSKNKTNEAVKMNNTKKKPYRRKTREEAMKIYNNKDNQQTLVIVDLFTTKKVISISDVKKEFRYKCSIDIRCVSEILRQDEGHFICLIEKFEIQFFVMTKYMTTLPKIEPWQYDDLRFRMPVIYYFIRMILNREESLELFKIQMEDLAKHFQTQNIDEIAKSVIFVNRKKAKKLEDLLNNKSKLK